MATRKITCDTLAIKTPTFDETNRVLSKLLGRGDVRLEVRGEIKVEITGEAEKEPKAKK